LLLVVATGALQDGELVNADAPKRAVEQAGAGFPRSGRLLKHSDFDRVYKQGRRHFSPHMTVFYLRQAEGAPPEKSSRVGFTVGRVLGGAVERNRIKRRLREAVRLRRFVLTGAVDVVGVDVVINPKKSVLKLEFAVVLEEVGRALDAIAKKLVEK
jgi:ribonuclease P protein component